ncbi:MAG: oxidoreductase [Gammaproteobacteria bacterium]|nr:oxidoreductase [Gammaproteobacteria bacterium]
MPRWRNWSGRLEARPAELRFPRSEEDVAALVRAAAADGRTVRAVGAGHSHAPLVPTDGVVVDLSGLSGVVATDPSRRTARVRAGTPIHALGRPLHDAGLALRNQGDIDRQTIAGACATGTHGTGAGLTCLSDAVVGARLILASGEIVECGPEQNVDLWQAARLNLGAVGIVTELTLALRDAYRLAERGWRESWDTLEPRLPALASGSRHFEFFWYPGEDEAVVKTIDETNEPPRYPLAGEGDRLAWSYEVLPNHRPHPHTEMEYSVPAAQGAACFAELRAMIRRDFPAVRWPVEYRLLAADDVWLSMASGRATVTLSVHQDVREDETAYYRACERIFLEYGGRPHWGKVHGLDGAALAAAHPHWRQWWAVRDGVDPDGVFLNDFLRQRRPA